MIRTAGLLGLAAILGALPDDGPAPLPVSARAAGRGPFRVGQPIEVLVGVPGEGGPAEILAPRMAGADAEVHRLLPGEAGPASARFVVVGARPGVLTVPPFRARAGGRSGASRPIRLAIEGVPAVGRPGSFLGGVGRFEARAEADPPGLRLGASLEYRLTLTGPAAWGSVRPPDLAGWASLGPGSRVEPLPGLLEPGEPPRRTFRYRVRPGRSGRVVLPPVSVASFDPEARSYSTVVAPGVPVAVEGPPRFDPARLDYGAGPRADGRLGGLALAVGAGSAVAGAWLARRRARSRRGIDPRRLAADLARGLGPGGDDAEAAGRVVEALAEFLRRAGCRPQGALTPPEARHEVERLTADGGLADRAGGLVAWSDRVRFGGRAEGSDRLVAEAREVLVRLGEGCVRGEAEGGSRDR